MTAAITPGAAVDVNATYSLDGLTFGAGSDGVIDLQTGTWWFVQKTSGWHNATGLRSGRSDRAWGNGQYAGPSLRKERKIMLQGLAIAPNVTARLDAQERMAALASDGARTYELAYTALDGRVRTASVQLDEDIPDNDPQGHSHRFVWTLHLVAPDPRKYGDWIDRLASPTGAAASPYGLDDSGGGLSDAGGGLSDGGPGPASLADTVNLGSAPVGPLLRLRGPLPARSRVVHLESGWSMTYGPPLADGELLWVNLDEHPQRGVEGQDALSSVRGNVLALISKSSHWPVLAPRTTANFQLRADASPLAELMCSTHSAYW